ncbi:MAG: hypothetical protein ACOX17_01505 [Christensenellales bacterium]|jgi:hypothetical protein
MKLKEFLKRNFPVFIGIAVGAAGGFLLYRYVGCSDGACLITANPVLSTLYGGIMGGLLGSVLRPGGCRACVAEKSEEGSHE